MQLPKDTPDVQEIAITPAIAAMWLENNDINRKLSRARVNQYARAMQADRWMQNNDAICLSEDDTLLNGQHRLHAIIQSGCTVRMMVRRNVPKEAMQHMDRQLTRSYTHQLQMRGETHTALLGSTLRLCTALSQGTFPAGSGGNAIGDTDMNIFLEKNPEIRMSVEVGSQLHHMVDATPTSIAATHWWIAQVAGHDYPAHYLHQLGEPVNVPPESAIHSVRRRLKSARLQKLENRNYMYLMVKGWNAYTQNKNLIRPQMAPSDRKFYIPEPLPYVENTQQQLEAML